RMPVPLGPGEHQHPRRVGRLPVDRHAGDAGQEEDAHRGEEDAKLAHEGAELVKRLTCRPNIARSKKPSTTSASRMPGNVVRTNRRRSGDVDAPDGPSSNACPDWK